MMNEPVITPQLVNDKLNEIATATYQSHFQNELTILESTFNMESALSEFFDLTEAEEVWKFLDQTIDHIKSIEEVFN
jgi:RNA binding exosome subunit